MSKEIRIKIKKFIRLHSFPIFKILPLKAILFYQKYISVHTCLYQPTCSEYTKQSINNYGVIIGIIMGAFRILRCNPLSKGGYDPVPEKFWKMKWLK